ncbi:hypothetical protein ACFQ3W_05740 [Paenibacillus puldeungensis]|uniref:Uncharacterized protein n=1 Tax=Paenibacillus puldeungensis TaxID=696536 RepID=A0ABW3RTM9_9BACL
MRASQSIELTVALVRRSREQFAAAAAPFIKYIWKYESSEILQKNLSKIQKG